MDPSHINFSKMENVPDFDDYFNFEENPFGMFLLPSPERESVFDFDNCNITVPTLPSRSHCSINFNDFEDVNMEFALLEPKNTTVPSLLHEDIVVDAKPLRTLVGNSSEQYYDNTTKVGLSETLSIIQKDNGSTTENGDQRRQICGRKRTAPLQLDEIQKYYDFPISKAAKELKVGLTVLKKRCRELNISRWPHRKIKSLKSLINNVKGLGLTNEIVMLEEHQRMLEKLPDMELTERTKKLRQACFKANYKKRRSLRASC